MTMPADSLERLRVLIHETGHHLEYERCEISAIILVLCDRHGDYYGNTLALDVHTQAGVDSVRQVIAGAIAELLFAPDQWSLGGEPNPCWTGDFVYLYNSLAKCSLSFDDFEQEVTNLLRTIVTTDSAEDSVASILGSAFVNAVLETKRYLIDAHKLGEFDKYQLKPISVKEAEHLEIGIERKQSGNKKSKAIKRRQRETRYANTTCAWVASKIKVSS